MSCYPPFTTVEGETLDLHICATIDAKDAVALLYYCGGDEKACVVQPCSLALSQYQLHIGPLGRGECVQLPYLSIATWGVVRASSSVAKAFAQVQQAEETARSCAAAAAAAASSSSVSYGDAAPSSVAPVLSPPGLPTRPRYADPLPSLFVVTLQTKHVWQHRLLVQSDRLLKNVKAHLAIAHCLARVTDLPAFPYAEERRRRLCSGGSSSSSGGSGGGVAEGSCPAMWNTEFGWNLYSPHREFTRQMCVDATRSAPSVATVADMQEGRIGVQRDLRPWFSLVDLRDEERQRDMEGRRADFFYTSSPTYPDLFLQPKLLDRELLLKAMNARSRARVPAISYVCLRTGAVLARSSQPLMRSPQLGADSDVCYTLINMGYVPHHTQPRHAASAATVNGSGAAMGGSSPNRTAAASPLAASPSPASCTHTSSIAAAAAASVASPVAPATAAAAAAAGPRPARPPSLFDDDEADGGSGGGGGATRAASAPAANTAAAAAPSSGGSGARGSLAGGAASPNGTSAHGATRTPPSPSQTTQTSAVEHGHGDGSSLVVSSGFGGSAKVLYVADCRPQITAAGNAQLGGGYESGSFYAFCNTNFFEIDNIFGVTKSFDKLRSTVARYQGNTPEKTFLRRLYEADWLGITQRVLVCAVTAAQSLQSGVSCLVHCTDGWDRTSQCTALAMLMLDPYYRTLVGFCTLIEKEFCSFGHKFAERSGHQLPGRTSFSTHSGVSSSDTETAQQQHGGAPRLDTSPIFLHFLDAVFQVHRQYPSCFEFSTELLAYLSEAVFGCLYGTFLCNGEQERRLEGVRLRTASIWTDVLRAAQREKSGDAPLRFVNVSYDAATAWKFIAQRRRGTAGRGPTSSSSHHSSSNTNRASSSGCASAGVPPPPQPSQQPQPASSSSSMSSRPAAAAAAPSLADFVVLPNCSSKRLVFWEALYLREDADRYLSYNPFVHHPQRQHKVTWGAEFEAFLDAEIAVACAERTSEVSALTALESFMAKEPAQSAVVAHAARSAWCVYDTVNCFNCYKAFSMWSSKTQCSSCKQYFCTDCQVHDCMLQQY